MDMMPRNTTTAVTNAFGVEATTLRSNADINPVPSATPTPIMMVNTVPSAKNPVKLDTTVVTMWRMLSGARRFTACTVFCEISPLALSRKSYVTDTPRAAQIADSTITIPVSIRKMVAGLGRPFPTRSTVSNARTMNPFLAFSFVITIPPLVYALFLCISFVYCMFQLFHGFFKHRTRAGCVETHEA